MIAVDLALGTLSAALLVLPGWQLARRFALPHPALAGFILSAVGWMWSVIVLDTADLPLGRSTFAIAWGAVLVVTTLASRRRSGGSFTPPFDAPTSPETGAYRFRDYAWLLVLAPVLAVVIYRAVAQPLFGADTIFRWDFLARQLLEHGTLAFYPPVSAPDFERYSWPDGIAPLVSSLYAAAYALAGGPRPVLTAPLVVLQFVLLVAAVHALARERQAGPVAPFAVLLLGCAAIVPWATGMGQETGLTALALVAMLLYLPNAGRPDSPIPSTLVAGVAAALGALAREYGLALIPLGLLLCAARRLGTRHLLAFAVPALAATLPWYLRNWIRTGHPLFNLPSGGLFPVNEVHAWLNESYRVEFGAPGATPTTVWILLANAGVLLLAGLLGALVLRRRVAALTAAAALFVLLWLASIPYTAAGFTYSLRVLNPALAVCAVLGGLACAGWCATPRRRRFAFVVLGLLSLDAALRALTLPVDVHRIPARDWLAVGRAIHDYHSRPIYREIVRVAGRDTILTLGPNALLTTLGACTVPLWSPAMAPLFNERLAPRQVADQLRKQGIGLIVLNRGAANERFLAHSPYLRDPGDTLRAVWSDADMVVLRLQPAAPSGTASP